MRITHLWKEENRAEEGRTRISVVVEEPGGEKTTLWYSIPEKYSSYITSSMDPFVLGTLFRAMSGADRMDVHGTVSPSLLANLEEFQSVWAEWLPDELKRIDIRAEEEQETTPAEEPGGALCAFSGGLDAAFTLYKHRMTDTGRRKRDINACLFVQGFDIPVDADEAFERVTARNRKMTDSIGIELITMKTNYKAVDVNWRHSHGLGVGSSLMVLNGGFSEGLIGSTFPYRRLVLPWGSNPITDPMMSSDSFRIFHDGSDAVRSDKIRLISGWSEARDNLQVCWESAREGRNCCECEKCIRTILNFRVIGAGLPRCFEKDVEDSQIVSLAGVNEAQLKFFEEILRIAEEEGTGGSWTDAVETFIKRNRSWWRLAIRHIRTRLALRARLRKMRRPGNGGVD